jgi:peptidoglycan/LPS O-acetylase OafA/YrhL
MHYQPGKQGCQCHIEDTPKAFKATGFWDTSYFPSLDGIRFLLIILVIGFHVEAPDPKQVPLQHYFEGTLSVDAFFVISGFLITTLLLREERKTGAISLAGFYIRRSFRIIPVYLLVVLAYIVIGLLPSQHDKLIRTLNGLPYFFSFRNEYVPAGLDVTLGHTWSLSVEEKFYFFWPLLYFILLPKMRAKWLIFIVPAALFFLITKEKLFLAYLSIFSGCVVGILMERFRGSSQEVTRLFGEIPAWAMAMAGVIAYLVALRYYESCKFLFSIYVCLLIPYLLTTRSAIGSFLSQPACVWMGKRAYAMYLFHAVFLNFTQNYLIVPKGNWSFILVVIVSYSLTLAAAQCIFLTLEKPMINLGRKLSNRQSQPKGSPAPAVPPTL